MKPAAQLPTSAQRPTESGWSCHLQAVAFSVPLMLVSRGRGWEEGGAAGGKAVLCGQAAGTFTSSQQEVRARRALPSPPAHTHNQPAKCVCSSSAAPPLNSMCVRRKGSRSQLVGRRLTSNAGLGSATPRLACVCLDNTCWQQWPRTDPHSASQVNQPIQELPGTGERQVHLESSPVGTNRCPWSLNAALILREYRAVRTAGNGKCPSPAPSSTTLGPRKVPTPLISQPYPYLARVTLYFSEEWPGIEDTVGRMNGPKCLHKFP